MQADRSAADPHVKRQNVEGVEGVEGVETEQEPGPGPGSPDEGFDDRGGDGSIETVDGESPSEAPLI